MHNIFHEIHLFPLWIQKKEPRTHTSLEKIYIKKRMFSRVGSKMNWDNWPRTDLNGQNCLCLINLAFWWKHISGCGEMFLIIRSLSLCWYFSVYLFFLFPISFSSSYFFLSFQLIYNYLKEINHFFRNANFVWILGKPVKYETNVRRL